MNRVNNILLGVRPENYVPQTKLVNNYFYMLQVPQSQIHHVAVVDIDNRFYGEVIEMCKAYESYNLQHHRFEHEGDNCMNNITKITKMKKVHMNEYRMTKQGNWFSMDFDFVRGPTDNNMKSEILQQVLTALHHVYQLTRNTPVMY